MCMIVSNFYYWLLVIIFGTNLNLSNTRTQYVFNTEAHPLHVITKDILKENDVSLAHANTD